MIPSLPRVRLIRDVVSREFVRDGKSRQMRHQVAYLHKIDGYGEEQSIQARIPLGSDQAPYVPGEYYLSSASLRVNQYGDLELDRFNIDLIPVSEIDELLGEGSPLRAVG